MNAQHSTGAANTGKGAWVGHAIPPARNPAPPGTRRRLSDAPRAPCAREAAIFRSAPPPWASHRTRSHLSLAAALRQPSLRAARRWRSPASALRSPTLRRPGRTSRWARRPTRRVRRWRRQRGAAGPDPFVWVFEVALTLPCTSAASLAGDYGTGVMEHLRASTGPPLSGANRCLSGHGRRLGTRPGAFCRESKTSSSQRELSPSLHAQGAGQRVAQALSSGHDAKTSHAGEKGESGTEREERRGDGAPAAAARSTIATGSEARRPPLGLQPLWSAQGVSRQ
jgi:hypothetical protein